MREIFRSNEKGLYFSSNINVSEEKNNKHMVRTGLSYARYPIWKPEVRSLGYCDFLITDQRICIFQQQVLLPMSFDFNKIIDVKTTNNQLVVEMKTTSIYPRKLYFGFRKANLQELVRIAKILNCLIK
jgi:hypothetical protein